MGSGINCNSINCNRNRYKKHANGKNNKVTIFHLSNHRVYTGTAFIERAIAELKEEGYAIDFIYPKKKIKNTEVKKIFGNVDIFIDGIIATGYGLAAMESMAGGTCTPLCTRIFLCRSRSL